NVIDVSSPVIGGGISHLKIGLPLIVISAQFKFLLFRMESISCLRQPLPFKNWCHFCLLKMSLTLLIFTATNLVLK
ncbi:MAG: hypothetical protein KDA74_17310, partial [Planctomycetaceae bacterium]|nr:hypothetical protein [Planctomycetaceae bacterium]